MKRAAPYASVLGLILVLSIPAHAEDRAEQGARAHAEPLSASSSHDRPAEWYGWQILLADVVSIGAVLVTPVTEGHSLYLGAGGFVLGGPIVHFAHGRPAIGAASLGLRLGVPLLAAAAGLAIGGEARPKCTPSAMDVPCDDGFGAAGAALAGAFIGLLGGMVTASALDIALLAHEPVQSPPPPVSVGVRPTRGGVALGAAVVW